MNAPKISVLIPLYNRKHYIEQCIDSVLAQTFQDFEIIVRDDYSSDGSADFFQERYATEISTGKLKLQRNKRNLGEFPTDNRLLREATGKYVMILHSDDLYLSHGLQHMYTVAEQFNADVVHGSIHFTTADDDTIEEGTPLKPVPNKQLKLIYANHNANKTELVSDDPFVRFDEWYSGGTFIDAQHNIFRREFLIDNKLRFANFGGGLSGGNRLFALKWLMKAKVFVKTAEPFYIHRNSPDSITKSKFPPERVAELISAHIEMLHNLEKFLVTNDFFKNKPDMQYCARSSLLAVMDNWWLKRNGVYKNGVTPELNQAVEDVFKKHYGADYLFPTFLFHWAHVLMYKRPVTRMNTESPTQT